MFLSVFEMFKIGIGPSSSHTMGPMVAARRFADAHLQGAARVRVTLYGSLAFTGKGHATDRAVILGLAGMAPDAVDADEAAAILRCADDAHILPVPGGEMPFDPAADIVFAFGQHLPGHTNAMRFEALDAAGAVLADQVFYSIGGGFVLTEAEMQAAHADADIEGIPFPFDNARRMLDMAAESGLSIAEMKLQNELRLRDSDQIDQGIARIWQVMSDCIDRGLRGGNELLPGGLGLRRRASTMARAPQRDLLSMGTLDRVAAYALAVNEENAAGGQVVTAPTNGAAGIIPAVLRHAMEVLPEASPATVAQFLLTAAAIGGLIKHNASVSGAECGCQAEVGSASAMAAAGLTAVMGGSPAQVENAAEIALEHHLGMTCDPVRGLVQVPCIERNAMGSIKAITAASLALHGDGTHFMPLDACIEAMRQTGLDMHENYKETSLGGLAVNSPNC